VSTSHEPVPERGSRTPVAGWMWPGGDGSLHADPADMRQPLDGVVVGDVGPATADKEPEEHLRQRRGEG